MANRRRQDHYEVLGVSPDAPEEVVRAAYRALAAKYHPDRNPNDPDAELNLKRINAAFQVLGNPEKRRQYDDLTRAPEPVDVSPKPKPEAPSEQRVGSKVSDERPEPDGPRWKVPGHSQAHVPNETARKKKSGGTTGRVLLALAAMAVSLYINLTGAHDPSTEANAFANVVGLLVGSGLLAVFLYWLAGKIPAAILGLGLALVAAAILGTRASGNEASSVSVAPKPARALAETRAPPPAPDVPALLPNETAPIEGPNYFEPREMSAGGIVAGFDSCQESASKTAANVNADVLAAYCTCVVDAMRRNLSTTADFTKTTPTADQVNRCAAAARAGGRSPYAYPKPRGTADLWTLWTSCVKNNSEKDHGVYCGCLVDLDTAVEAQAHIWPDVSLKPTLQQFIGGCEVADQYWAATKAHLTVRQFKANVVKTLVSAAGSQVVQSASP